MDFLKRSFFLALFFGVFSLTPFLSVNASLSGAPLIVVSPSSITTTEGAADQTFTISLGDGSLAAASIIIPLSSSKPSRVTVPSSAVIATSTRSVTVTATTVNNLVNDDTEFSTITTGNSISSYSGYNNFNPADISVTSIDNDLGTPANVTGWAWGAATTTNPTDPGGIGWISLNCLTGGSGGTSVCGAHDYGLNIDASGNFSGYGWSDSYGWISFNASDLSAAQCPQAASAGKIAYSTGAVTGWAKVLSTNNACDGYIELSGTYHLSPNTSGSGGLTYNAGTGKIVGYAWGGGEETASSIGWINFYDVSFTAPFSATCSVTPSATVTSGTPVTWSVAVLGGVSPLTYLWSGTDTPGGSASSTVVTYTNYTSSNVTKHGVVKITDANGTILNPTCPSLTVNPAPVEPVVSLTCNPEPSNPRGGSPVAGIDPVTFYAQAICGTSSSHVCPYQDAYTFNWSGTNTTGCGTSNSCTTNASYSSSGTKIATVSVSGAGSIGCSATVIDQVVPIIPEGGNGICPIFPSQPVVNNLMSYTVTIPAPAFGIILKSYSWDLDGGSCEDEDGCTSLSFKSQFSQAISVHTIYPTASVGNRNPKLTVVSEYTDPVTGNKTQYSNVITDCKADVIINPLKLES